ncbi:MAG: bifunctional precorrin-2 dehydrogenase/sirohydrochlorin ferrochelatase [Acidobacteriaceae bacterium]|nr:bifunctional precorrin-2 dehydrogenase/sirohydrochlorin ferrochelatase [Acidobacteriaceae bacterium]
MRNRRGTGNIFRIEGVNFRYPVFLDLTGKKCLVTGEGPEIAGKIRALTAASAAVTYVNERASPEIQALASAGSIHWESRGFQPEDLTDCFLVITDSGDNSEIFRLAEERGVLCNAVDDPKHCRFSFGSVHRQGDLTIAISTNGGAPAVAVRLRQWLEREIGPEYGALLKLLKTFRREIMARIPDFKTRRDLWYRIVDSDVRAKVREGHYEAAQTMIRQMLEDALSSTSRSGISDDERDR